MSINRVLIYVEGPSDQLSMKTLFASLISKAEQKGVRISFHVLSKEGKKMGGKHALINKGVARAAATLANDPDACVVIMPDLYPRDQGGPHRTPEELDSLIREKFRPCFDGKPKSRGVDETSPCFKTFCFKHDLEALLLAAHEQMASHLGVERIVKTWTEPVEDQDQENYPKRVVEEIFKSHHRKYVDTNDAPAILEQTDLDQLVNRCPQCFKPFVEFIRGFAI